MNILIGLVIAMFIITAAYVGYHAMQEPVEEVKGHSIELDFLNKKTGMGQTLQNLAIFKAFS